MTSSHFDAFEDKLRTAVQTPQPRPEFLATLRARLIAQPPQPISFGDRLRWAFRRPAVAASLVVLLLVAGFVIIGPQRVVAAVRGLFGYIPDVGIVDTSAPIRVLAEPVSVTRDGITVTVTSATLTADRTHIDYRIFGVPSSAYPDREDVHGCWSQPYLRLADGAQLAQVNNGYQPVPASVSEAIFVVPCITNTLPSTVPENWELQLRFVAAPLDLTVMPVIELSPSAQASLIPDVLASSTPAAPANSPVTVSKVIETSDGYILIGQFQPVVKPGESFQQTGTLEIRDASGKLVSHTYPLDVNNEINQQSAGMPGGGWAAQFKAAGLVYPLTIRFSGVNLFPADPGASAEFTFDAGANPQPGQEWRLNQEIQLAGHTLTLTFITVDSRGGYSFHFQVPPEVYSASVQIAGYTPNGGGGGMGNGQFNRSLSFAQLPTGLLTVTISDLILVGDANIWQGQWSPASPRTDLPANPTPQPGLCLTADSLAQLQPAPSTLSSGKALIYEELEPGIWGLAIYTLDGGQKQVVAENAAWGALSPDGDWVAYMPFSNSPIDMHLMDLRDQSIRTLPGVSGTDYHWSPDGMQIAYVGMGNGGVNSVFVINTDGTQMRQISDLSYGSIIGWSPDGALYYVVPYTGGAAWKVFTYDFTSNSAQERFTIENGTPKFLNPHLSPDGDWIAYRGQDNSSLYLARTDGSDMHLVLDNVGAVGMGWSRSGWLGISLRKPNSDAYTVVMIQPERCEGYLLPDTLHGDLQGLFIP